MHYTPTFNTQKLKQMLIDAWELPLDEKENHSFLRPLELPEGSALAESFHHLIEHTFLHFAKGGRNHKQTEQLRHHLHLILLNLCSAMYQRNWLCIAGDSNEFTVGKGNHWLNSMELGYRTTYSALDFLRQQKLVEFKRGIKSKANPMQNHFYPKPDLIDMIGDYFTDLAQPIEGPHVIINDPEDEWSHPQALDGRPEQAEMTEINEFLKDHSWACKAPVVLKYKRNPSEGGRLYTPFLNLPDKSLRIRINTLIDGEPIAEVDFSANHLRLNLALNGGGDAGEDPYSVIGKDAGQDRDVAKTFMTVALGAASEGAAKNSCKLRHAIYSNVFEPLLDSTRRLYPKLQLFSGWAPYGQNLDGRIIKDVMLEGVREGIVALPIHDAVAVQQRHIEWAKKQMLASWGKITGTEELARVKVDLP